MSHPLDLEVSGEAAFRDAFGQLFGTHTLRFRSDDEPHMSSYRFGQCRISKLRLPAFDLEFAKEQVSGGMEDQLIVLVDRTAASTYRTDAAEFDPTARAILIVDHTDDAVGSADEPGDYTALSFPRALLPPTQRGGLKRPVAIPAANGGLALVFRDMICAAADQQEVLTVTERDRLQRSLIALVGDLIANALTGGDEEGPLGLAALRTRAVAMIEAELLTLHSVEDLSDRLGCSARNLYNAFAEWHTTPARYLWSLRLERAREQIMSAGSEVSITEIAYGCGFQSYSHFSRAFKKQFGLAPQSLWNQRGQAEMPIPATA